MAPTRRSRAADSNKSDTATASPKESNATPVTSRKRGRPQSEKPAEPAAKVEVSKENKDEEKDVADLDVTENKNQKEPAVKRKRGRPAKLNEDGTKKVVAKEVDPSLPKRGRGRPRKVVAE